MLLTTSVCAVFSVYHTWIMYSQRHGSISSWLTAAAVQLIQRRRLRLFGHVAKMDVSLDISRALKTSIRGLPTNWKLPPGRPRYTWLRTLGADLQPHNLGLNSAWKYAQDREHWKHLVETATLQLGARAWWWWWWYNNNGNIILDNGV